MSIDNSDVIPEPTQYHRDEVTRRASAIVRKRRLVRSAIGLSVVFALSGSAVFASVDHSQRPTKVASATTTTHTDEPNISAPSATKSGSTITPNSSTPTTTAPTTPTTIVPITRPTPSPAITTAPSPSSGQKGTGPGVAGGGQNANQTYIDLPSGTSQPLYEDNFGVISLPAPSQATWGSAFVSAGSAGLTIWQQTTNPDNSIQVVVESRGAGTATVTVPNAGNSGNDWSITFVISGTAQCVQNGIQC
jgi:hypothetical protein